MEQQREEATLASCGMRRHGTAKIIFIYLIIELAFF